MAGKSGHSKSAKRKNESQIEVPTETNEVEESVPVSPKSKIPIEIPEEEEAPLLPLEDKADPLAVEDDSEESADDIGLDEEIDPFGDKWES